MTKKYPFTGLTSLLLAAWLPAMAVAQIAFEEVTTQAGINLSGRSMGLEWGDYDGDGWLDLYTSHHSAIDVLYRNNRNGTFTNVFPGAITNPSTPDTHAAAFGDFDNDGDQDIMQLSGAQKGSGSSPNEFYVMTNGKATNEAQQWGVDDPEGRGRTPLWLDWNNDGKLDLFFSNLKRPDGKAPSALFLRVGNGFQRTTLPGLTPKENSLFAQSSELLGDGRRMLIVSGDNYPQRIVAFGTDGSVDLRSQLRIPQTANVRDVAIEDFNGDLLPDFFMVRLVPNSSEVNLADSRTLKVHFNLSGTERGLTFRCDCTLTVTTGPGFELKPTSIFIGKNGLHPKSTTFSAREEDPTADGIAPHTAGKSFGLYVGHEDSTETWTVLASKPSRMALNVLMTANADITQVKPININSEGLAQPSRLLLRTATGYVDAPNNPAIAQKRPCESVAAGDFDNDMDVDLYLVCRGQTGNLPNVLMENDGHGVFTVVPQAGGAEGSKLGRGDVAACGDYDHDGFLDMAIANGNGEPPFDDGPYQLYHNKGNGNHWLELKLRGVTSNRDGVGARVIVTAGGLDQMREQNNRVHRLAQCSQVLHFGLAKNTAVSKVVVYWPSGTVQTLDNVAADQILTVTEDGTAAASFTLTPASLAFGNQLHNTTSAPKAVTVTNTGASPLPINSRKLGGTNPGQFLIASTNCPVTVAVGGNCAINIALKPTTTGNKTATLTVQAGAGAGSHTVSLSGKGT